MLLAIEKPIDWTMFLILLSINSNVYLFRMIMPCYEAHKTQEKTNYMYNSENPAIYCCRVAYFKMT